MAFNKAKALQEAEKLVSQGKTSLAIKQYQDIAQRETTDFNLLNTIGDLYVREKNIPKALEQFRKLAEAYVREGFTVKAIAMYKKISKLDSSAVEPILKLAELYQLQGLAREAREQYAQAVDFYRKRNENEKAVEVLRAVVRLDPDNAKFRLHLGEFCESAGLNADAAQTYLEAAEVALRRKDTGAAEAALRKVSSLDPTNLRAHLLEAQVALGLQQPARAEKILSSLPQLKTMPEGRRLLLEAYLGTHKLEAAQELVSEVYQASPEDFSPLASFATLCVEKGSYDTALKVLAATADSLIAQRNTAPLMQCLRRIWEKCPHDIPLLELMYRIADRTGDEAALPEVLEALGHAYVQAGELEKAEVAYRKLTEREPADEGHRGLLKQVLQKLGKEVGAPGSPDLSDVEMALAEPEPAVSPAPAVDAEEAAAVKEALENSDLYFRYGSVDKALAELEKVLAEYPDQIDIHKRIVEVSKRKLPARAAQAEQVLARIYAQREDSAKAKKYEDLARQDGAVAPVPVSPPTAAPEVDRSTEFASSQEAPAAAPQGAATATPEEFPLGVGVPPVSPQVSVARPQAPEVDLSADLDAFVAPSEAPQVARAAPAFNYEESHQEISFYLDNGFAEEAQKAVLALEEKFPGNSQVAELRRLVDERARAKPAEVAEPAAILLEPTPTAAAPEVVVESLPEEPRPAAPIPAATPPPVGLPGAPQVAAPVSMAATPRAAESAGDALGSLASDLASSLEGIEALPAARPAPSVPPLSPPHAEAAKARARGPLSPLSDLLDELGGPAEQQTGEDDAETHYNLGVAFREMGLLDEAIGEFQKVVRGGQKEKFPPNFLQACTLLAICFIDKKMPAIATKWYARALEAPGLDEEAQLALQYDMGIAYEQAGDTRTALEKFTEVYSQNIDYRDVAEKIRLLQQKGT